MRDLTKKLSIYDLFVAHLLCFHILTSMQPTDKVTAPLAAETAFATSLLLSENKGMFTHGILGDDEINNHHSRVAFYRLEGYNVAPYCPCFLTRLSW